MKRFWTLVLAAVIVGIGLIPAPAPAGGPYAESWEKRWFAPQTAPCSTGRYDGYLREKCGTIYHQSVVRVKPQPTKIAQNTIVIVDCQKSALIRPCATPKKVKPMYVDPCPTELQKAKDGLLAMKNKLEAALERERIDSIEIRKLEKKDAIWMERDRVYKNWYYTGWLPYYKKRPSP